MRMLGVDFGFKRIGIAVMDTAAGIPGVRACLEASGSLSKDAAQIAVQARKEEAGTVVIGLPVEPSGLEGKMARIVRNLGEHIAALGYQVAFVDESLSTVIVEERLLGEGLKASRRKKRRDGEAAALILERYLHENPPKD